jgi:hypothetical protein
VQSHPHGTQTIDPVLGVLMGQASLAGLAIDGDAVTSIAFFGSTSNTT